MARSHFAGFGLAIKAAILAAGLGISAGRAAEMVSDWRLVNWSDDTVLYIDHARLRPQGDLVKYWAKVVYLKDPAYSEILSEVQINCTEQSFRNLSIAGYYHGGLVHRETAKLDWRPVTKGTNIEREMQHVCKAF